MKTTPFKIDRAAAQTLEQLREVEKRRGFAYGWAEKVYAYRQARDKEIGRTDNK